MELRVSHLSKFYGTQEVLHDLSFTANEGITCVMGPSGVGKTTLLRLLLGLEKPDSGKISLTEPGRNSAVFQENRLLEQLDAMENIRFVLGREFQKEKAEMLLQKLGLDVKTGQPVREFSGGMKRRLALARALLQPSELLLLDEPFSGLDKQNRIRALKNIQQVAKKRIVLLVTHEESDTVYADSVIRL